MPETAQVADQSAGADDSQVSKTGTNSSALDVAHAASELATNSRPSRLGRRGKIYTIAVAVIVVAVFLVFWVLMGGFQSNPASSTVVLVPAGTYYTVAANQLNEIGIVVNTAATINGTIAETYGLGIYLMTPTQLAEFVKTLQISGYVWTSGNLTNNTIYRLNLAIQPGSWDLVFVNPNSNIYITTSYGFYTDLTLIK